jgi:uncharacterized membrane protein YedE/YeeE
MNSPLSTSSPAGLVLAGLFGLVFGILLHKGRVTDYNVIVNLFRFRDWTVLKIMLTAIVVGGLGVFVMMNAGWLEGYHLKNTNLPGLLLGGGLFGIGMAVYGYCPGTGIAAVATGSVHALVGVIGMLAGGIAYALSFAWVKANLLSVGDYGKIRLTDLISVPEWILWALLSVAALLLFRWLEKKTPRRSEA